MAHLPHEQRSLNRSAALALLCALAAPGQAQQRIVTVAPSLTESVCALGHCSQIVGTDRYSSGPGPVAQLPKVGGLADASIEHIVALRPDLVLLGPRTRLDERLKQLGIAVRTFPLLEAGRYIRHNSDALARAILSVWQEFRKK